MSLVGKKAYGFEFTGHPSFCPSMKYCIGKIGTIEREYDRTVTINFGTVVWKYPKHSIERYLLDPSLPVLSKGVEYMVSDNNVNWFQDTVIAILEDGTYLTDKLTTWKYGKKPEIKE